MVDLYAILVGALLAIRMQKGNEKLSKEGNKMALFGFLGKKKAVTYKKVDSRGRATYIGVTNNPLARAKEHNSSGKPGRFVVTSKITSRKTALRNETRNLRSYKKAIGKRPKYNKTWNGKFNK